MSTHNFQFYPTPLSLAERAWAKFQNKTVIRLLEPSAGNGDLLKGMPEKLRDGSYNKRAVPIDCIEINMKHHATLRAIGNVKIVGMDFLEFGGGANYSHILLNPPFAEGAAHVIKAWDCLFDGEIVAIINAETIRNPFSKERQHLKRLIDLNGDVEFMASEFETEDTQRKTNVEIALVYLRKKVDMEDSIVGNVLSGLKKENELLKAGRLAEGIEEMQAVMLPTSTIENSVIVFDAAVSTMRELVVAMAKAGYYEGLMSVTMAEHLGDSLKVSERVVRSTEWVKNEISDRYLKLKDSAWTGILRSSDVTAKLSLKARQRLEAEFENIKELEFTVSNIHGFLLGLAENQGDIFLGMVCDVFDLIGRYHSDNVSYYKGWKSNDKQRTCGMRVKTTRFVLPGNMGWSSLSYEGERRLEDFDRVFAMLDGKAKPDFGLVDVFKTQYSSLSAGERLQTSYFDVRFYPGVGTIHFFARDKVLMDRLNRLVGENRKWLPPAEANVSETFWEQYQKSEKFDKELRSEIDVQHKASFKDGNQRPSQWNHPLRGESDKSQAAIDAALNVVLERHGISVDFQLGMSDGCEQEQLLLLAA
jgi:hypothetical protein